MNRLYWCGLGGCNSMLGNGELMALSFESTVRRLGTLLLGNVIFLTQDLLPWRLCLAVWSGSVWQIVNLPDWASPGNWLGPEGHADFKNPVDDPSLCSLCSFPLKLFNDEAETMSSLNVFHLLTILSEKKCCLRSVITRFLCNFMECHLVLSLRLNSKNNVLNLTVDSPWIIKRLTLL